MPNKKRKTYGQYCTISVALDLIGERWTALILRELLGGAARFHELQTGLSGIPKNLLADRLRQLEADALVERIQLHGSSFYALTAQGESIRKALEELGIWGAQMQRLGQVEHERSLRSIAMTLHAILTRTAQRLPTERLHIELEVDQHFLNIVLGPHPSVKAQRSNAPDARFQISQQVLSDFLGGKQLQAQDFLHLHGNHELKETLLKALQI